MLSSVVLSVTLRHHGQSVPVTGSVSSLTEVKTNAQQSFLSVRICVCVCMCVGVCVGDGFSALQR